MIIKINHWLKLFLSLSLLVILAKVLVDTFWLYSAGPSDRVAVPEHLLRLEAIEKQQARVVSQDHISQWQLFGEKEAEQIEVEEIKEAPDTRLSLELVGLFAHVDKAKAVALIVEKGKGADLYRVGDSLPNKVDIVEIHRDRVILRRQGKHETLRMKENTLSANKSVSQVSGIEEATPQRRSNRRAAPKPASNEKTDGAFVIPGDSPQQQRQAIINELALKPVSESGAEGYVIGDSAPAALIGAVGLRVGDQIVSVNGQMLGEEQQDVAILNDVLVSGTATIEVVRGTRRFTVNYPP